jgi:class 3 adenylate cyclase/tetratricopeptide (TPR) repeat protein
MQCPRCQHENTPKAKFCEECAALLARTCANCGTQLSPTAKFCPECAHSVAAGPAEPRFAAPQSYTPRHLAEKILSSKAALEGERKQVTVLFADLKGSMELLADRDPEEARKLLDPILEHMMEAVHRYEGTVNQVMGDGIMALFGAPLALEDHPVRACYAALRLQETVKKYGDEVFHSHGVTVRIRVGLNSGEVVVRAIGSDLHMDYTAVGQTTHLAARMEQLADPGTILVSPATLQLVEGYVEVKGKGPVPIKGLEASVEVYELVGAGSVRSRLQAAAARGLTRFVGRDPEMEQLRLALERAAAGHGQVVAVVGEAGVGKSRLVYEVTHSYRTQGWLILEGASASYAKTTPYLPVIDLLKTYFRVEGRDDTRTIREKVMGKILSLDRQLEPALSALLSLLDVPVEDAAWEHLDPPQRRLRTMDAVKRVVLRESQVQPLVVVVEDLHWIDAETQSLLDSLVESLPTARLLLLVNYRPEYQHGWGSKTYYRHLRIDPLPAEGADDLLASLLGADASLEPLKRTLIERTEGNPLFLEESARTLVETRALVGEPGAYRLAQELQAIQMPPTVQAILAARIDRLSPDDKRLLQAAAVIGKDVPFSLLQILAELPEADVHRCLTRLQAAEYLYEARLFPDLEYTFKHTLTYEVAYAGLLHERRRALHGQVLEAMEGLRPDRLAEQVERIARHALRAEQWEKAVAYLSRASTKAAARSAYRDAAAQLEQAIDALDHWPAGPKKTAAAIDLRLALRDVLTPLGRYDEALVRLREADALFETTDDPGRRGQVGVGVCQALRILGDYAGAVREGQRATVFCTSGGVALQALATWRLGQAQVAVGEYAVAIDLLQRAERLSTEVAATPVGYSSQLGSRIWLAIALSSVGRFGEATAYADEAVRLAEVQDRPLGMLSALGGLGLLSVAKGDPARAISVLERAVAIARRSSIVDWFTFLVSSLGQAYTMAGRPEEALPLVEEAVEYGRTYHYMFGHAAHLAARGQTYLACDRIPEALASAQEALDLARRSGERGSEVLALRLYGAVHTRREPPALDGGEDMFCEALRIASQIGARPQVAHCHLGLGKLYQRTGKGEQARDQRSIATSMYRDMGMTYWLEQAERYPANSA